MKYLNIKEKLTIVIPCYNEENYLKKTVESIYKQIYIEGTRVIISDNHSTDRTRQIIHNLSKMYADKLRIELIDGGPVAVSRNLGSDLVDTEYVLFMDADTHLFTITTIYETLNNMIDYELDLLTCKIKSISNDIKSKIIFSLFNILNNFISLTSPFAVGTYFLTRIDIFRKLGKFDETYKHSEDYGLSRKYNPTNFMISKNFVGQDNRRFKKFGYINMLKLVINSYKNRNNPNFFKKDVGYW
jgi:glycosyltransferase involved in cell wall biosynthesis